MRNRRFAVLFAVAFALAVALPSTAAADDQAVWHAYAHSASTHRLVKAIKRFSKAIHVLDHRRHTAKRLANAYKASRRMAKAANANHAAIESQSASSDDGAEGRRLLLKAVAEVHSGGLLVAKGIRAEQRGHHRRAVRLDRRAARTLKRAKRDQRSGVKAMRKTDIDTRKKRAGR